MCIRDRPCSATESTSVVNSCLDQSFLEISVTSLDIYSTVLKPAFGSSFFINAFALDGAATAYCRDSGRLASNLNEKSPSKESLIINSL